MHECLLGSQVMFVREWNDDLTCDVICVIINGYSVVRRGSQMVRIAY